MDTNFLKSVCIRSARDMYEYGCSEAGVNEVVTDVVSYVPTSSGHLMMTLESPVEDTVGLYLIVDGLVMESGTFSFPFYDKDSRTLAAILPAGIRDSIIHMRPKLQVASDLSFLARRTWEYYEEYGSLIRIPERTPDFPDGTYAFPAGMVPSPQQREAVRTILNSRLSYVWGAPGTGKTQMVLATAVMAYMAAGRRVAVIAPTNNSVEQVLRGIVKVIRGDADFGRCLDLDRNILRAGSATEDFMAEFPLMCEDRCIDDLIEREGREAETLRKVLDGRSGGRFRADLLLMKRFMQGLQRADGPTSRQIRKRIDELRRSVSAQAEGNADLSESISGGVSTPEEVDAAILRLSRAKHPAADLPRYSCLTREELAVRYEELQEHIRYLEHLGAGADFRTARIIACTPQIYMMRYAPNGHEGKKPALDVDHIFVDEAGYCGLMNALGLFANNVPVTFLGDHKQLPPVCQVEEEDLEKFIARRGFMECAFLWSYPALYCESVLDSTLEQMEERFLVGADPLFRETSCCSLTESHRFGTNLARILDRHVYHNGISGDDTRRLEIVCIDVKCPPRDQRENRPEAEAVSRFIQQEHLVPDSFCILTPYKHQIRILKEVMPEYRQDILTVHRSQGREWDTVVLSVQDGEGIVRDIPLRFTSSKSDIGMKIVNTAVSRARKRLVIVCDRAFWMSQADELIGDLVSDDNCGLYHFSQ